MLKSRGEHIARAFKNLDVDTEEPEWLRRPERASYPVPLMGGGRWADVLLDPGAGEWLASVTAGKPDHPGPFGRIEVWLSREGAAGIAVHVGVRQVGRLRDSDAGQFERIMRAAALFDEDPFLRGRLSTLAELRSFAGLDSTAEPSSSTGFNSTAGPARRPVEARRSLSFSCHRTRPKPRETAGVELGGTGCRATPERF
ncbi:MAG TPA: hypothetical protein VK816_08420 [Jatrophihabitantaceae bacterium]|nr:hypothetical protein [Jatrophihabitantaceae bacterium]